MALKFFTGFEMGDTTEFSSVAGTTPTIQSTTKQTGDNAVKMAATTTGTSYGYFGLIGTTGAMSIPAPFNISTIYVSFDFNYHTKPASASEPLFQLHDGSGAKFELRLTSGGVLVAYDATASVLDTGETVLSADTWYRLDVKCGTGTSAPWEVRIDGSTEISGTSSNLSASDTDRVYIGKQANRNSQSIEFYYDNLFVDDADYVSVDAVVERMGPNADGTYTAWTGTGTDWENLDETVLSTDTSYLTSTLVSGDASTVGFESASSAGISGTILGVILRLAVARDGASSGTIAGRIRSGGVNSDTANSTVSSSSPSALARLSLTDPSTSAAWTTTGLDGIEAGVVEKNTTNASRVYAVQVMVAFVAATTPTATVTDTVTASDVVYEIDLKTVGTVFDTLTLTDLASASTTDITSDWIPEVGDDIDVLYCTPDEYLFRGTILRVSTRVQNGQTICYDIEAVDYTWNLEHQVALGGRYKRVGINTVVTDLLESVAFGVGRGHLPSSLGDVAELRIEAYTPVSRALTRLAKLVGGYWRLTSRDSLVDLFVPGGDEDGNRPILTNSSTIRQLLFVRDGTQMRNYTVVIGSGGTVTTPARAMTTSLTVSEVGWYSANSLADGLLEGTVLRFNAPAASGVGTVNSITSAETGLAELPHDVPEGAILRTVATYQATSASAAYGVLAHTIPSWDLSAATVNSLAAADVGLYAWPLSSLRYTTDARWIQVGQYVSASITTPTSVVGTFVIQRVTITPRIVTASVVSLDKTVEAGTYHKDLSALLARVS